MRASSQGLAALGLVRSTSNPPAWTLRPSDGASIVAKFSRWRTRPCTRKIAPKCPRTRVRRSARGARSSFLRMTSNGILKSVAHLQKKSGRNPLIVTLRRSLGVPRCLLTNCQDMGNPPGRCLLRQRLTADDISHPERSSGVMHRCAGPWPLKHNRLCHICVCVTVQHIFTSPAPHLR
jgi:hypothetical protein